MFKKIYHTFFKNTFRKICRKDQTETKCKKQIAQKLEHITHEVVEEVIEKITFFAKFIGFLTVFTFTFLRFLLFLFRFFVYPITILVLFASFLIVYISFSPDKNLTNVIHGFIFTHNIFSKNNIIAPTINITRDTKNIGLIYIDADTIKVGKLVSIKNLHTSVNVFKLLVNKTINFNIISGGVDIKIDNTKKTNLYETINNVAKFIDSTLTKFLPLKNNFSGNLHFNISSLDKNSNYNTSFDIKLKLYQDGIIMQENKLSVLLQNFKSSVIEILNKNQDLQIKCTKEFFSFVCNIDSFSNDINIKNFANFNNLSLSLILEKSIKYQTYSLFYNVYIKNANFKNNSIIKDLLINDVKIIGDLKKLNIYGKLDDDLQIDGEVAFADYLSYQTIKSISNKIKNVIRQKFILKNPTQYCSSFANYQFNIKPQNINNHKKTILKVINLLNIKALEVVSNNLNTNLEKVKIRQTQINGDFGKNCLDSINVNSNIFDLQYLDLSNQNSQINLIGNNIDVNFYNNKLSFVFSEDSIININNDKNNLQVLKVVKNSNVNFDISNSNLILDINFVGQGQNLLQYFSFLNNKILLDLTKNTISSGLIKMIFPFKNPSNLQMFIKLNFDKFYSYFVEAQNGLSVLISKQKNKNEYIITSQALHKNDSIKTLAFESDNYFLLGIVAANKQQNTKQASFYALDSNGDMWQNLQEFDDQNIDNVLKQNYFNYNNLYNSVIKMHKFVKVNVLSSINGIENIAVKAQTNENNFDFSYDKNQNAVNLKGELASLALPLEIYYNQNHVFKSKIKEDDDINDRKTSKQNKINNIFNKIASSTFVNINVNIANVKLNGDISTPLKIVVEGTQKNQNMQKNNKILNFANINNFVIDSNLLSASFRSSIDSEKDKNLIIKIESLERLFTAFNISFGNFKITNGSLEAFGYFETNNKQSVFKVSHKINGVSIKSSDKFIDNINGGFDSIAYLKSINNDNAFIFDSEKLVEIFDIKFSNAMHTVFGKGFINLADLTIDAKLSYSPTLLYQAQHTPIIGNVLDAVSLYRDEGFSSISYTITGNMFSPQIKFGSVSFLMFKIGRIGK